MYLGLGGTGCAVICLAADTIPSSALHVREEKGFEVVLST